MGRSASPRTTGYLKYLIPVIIIIALALFFLLRTEREKESERVVRQEAIKHIESLKKAAEETIDVEKADHFVSPQTLLSRKERKTLITTPKELLKDQSLTAESPIKILVEEEKTVITTPREILKSKNIGPTTPIRVLKKEVRIVLTTPRELLEKPAVTLDTPIRVLGEEGSVVVTTPRELLESESITLDTPIRVLTEEERTVVTTPQELLKDQSITLDTPIKIVLKEERILVTTPGQLLSDRSITPETPIKVVLEEPGEMVTLSELLSESRELSEKRTFYVHTVSPQDTQGIWGIIQHGLTTQFRQGIPVSGARAPGEESILALDIPIDADEPRENGYSSFLGKVLDQKTRDSHVYNYRNGRMGKNPDRISPGQELVIIEFSQEELVEIYEHFKQLR